MKKFLLIIFVLCFCLVGCGNNDNNLQNAKEENNNYNVSRTTTTNENNTENDITDTEIKSALEEIDIASFSTKIYTPNDEARQNNITLTCSKLNGTVVKSRRNFFFL
ncbi:MAG: hypothetical protein IJB90_00535 [Clostridia bacterium]|nr:hypothetical protein [Clostridia bacterium]